MKKMVIICSFLLLTGLAQAQKQGNLASAIARVVVPSQEANKFLAVVSEGNLHGVKMMLEGTKKGSRLVNVKDPEGNTPLILAIKGFGKDFSTFTPAAAEQKRENYWQIIELLGENGAYVNTTNEKGWTALCYASRGWSTKIVKFLLDRNAHVDHLCGGKEKGVTPLYLAAWSKATPDVIQLLVDAGADVNFLSPASPFTVRRTPLMGAVSRGQVGVVSILLDAGADINAETRNIVEGRTAAWIAVDNKDWFMLRWLVEHGGHLMSYLNDDVMIGIRERKSEFPPEIIEYLESKGYDFDRPTRLRLFLYQGGDYVGEYSEEEMMQFFKTGKLKKK